MRMGPFNERSVRGSGAASTSSSVRVLGAVFLSSLTWSLVVGCGGKGFEAASGGRANLGGDAALGGNTAKGGAPAGGATGAGGNLAQGGSPANGGSGVGGAVTSGGSTSRGGASAGGAAGKGGASSGGTAAKGGAANGGAANGGAAGVGGASTCTTTSCGQGLSCCAGKCVNLENDILNCGSCGTRCASDVPYCSGTCTKPPCESGAGCSNGQTCCGTQCCGAGQLCCTVNHGVSTTSCVDAVDGTCPTGCPACVCAAPDTPIATPTGDRPIAELRVGDLIYSVSGRGVVVVRVLEVNRVPVNRHVMLEIEFANGTKLRLSPGHPSFERRKLEELAAGDRLDGALIRSIRRVPYGEAFTYDILADSETGAYFAGGVLMGSTLARPSQIALSQAAH